MASGGARARSGPPPDPTALRRDRKDDAEWAELPAAGRDGPVPQWPLDDVMGNELDRWAREWRRPQAVMWETRGQELEVALFVRSITVSEGPKATAADRNVTQRKMTDLGITTPGLRANRWRIVAAPTASAAPSAPARRSRAKTRLKVVEGGKSSSAGADDGGRT